MLHPLPQTAVIAVLAFLVLARCDGTQAAETWEAEVAWLHQNSDSSPSATLESLHTELEKQASELEELRGRLNNYESLFGTKAADAFGCDGESSSRRRPVVVETPKDRGNPMCEATASGDSFDEFYKLDFYPTYDSGFVIRSVNQAHMPYELVIPGWIQFRHHGFARDVNSWTDNAGVTREVRNRNAFDIERARLYLLGWVHDERLKFFMHLDADTDGMHAVDFFDYWWSWDFSDDFRIQLGKRKVAASRQWLLGARRTRLVDRPMSNDFFRPDRTIGIFALGKTGDSGFYELMVGNGYSTSNLANVATDDRLTFAGTQYFDPLGKFGEQLADYDCTSNPLIRFGHSFVYSPQRSDRRGAPLPQTDFIRLSDGTRLNQFGALAAGVTVSDFDVYFYSADFAIKYRGWSMNAELFLRWLESIRADGPIPNTELFQRGFYVEGGRFVIPGKLDFNARYSEVRGLFGNATEYSAGANWYPLDSSRLKISLDVTKLDGSPLQNTASDILVGDDGILVRTQFQAEF